MIDVELRGGADLARISRALRDMDNPEVVKRFRRELREAAKPLVPQVRASIQAIPSRTGKGTLRAEMSRATRIEVRTTGRNANVAIRVDGRKMPTSKRSLQAYMEGTKRPWRHPVFGNREVWVRQEPKPYFFRVVAPAAGPRSRAAVNRVLDSIDREIS
ncbi:hypothetical protein STRCI_001263 [Streptomyces cinnabarinus]|uniref:HK97 gp10 family phage protein n=1 Tax=Streptomyces cinnabarinus TaxID=67287 RepID=A0ABY7KB57_9ACTN|nr:hypothetical protein [Streptomyces cinnabarinus]WAZ20164.1 hypothetical protein STRCI_001263 [Streptomyces cinnabarinus]